MAIYCMQDLIFDQDGFLRLCATSILKQVEKLIVMPTQRKSLNH